MFMLAFSYHDDFCDTKSCDEFVDFISLAALQPVHNRLGSMGYELQEFEKLFFFMEFFCNLLFKVDQVLIFLYPELSFF
jgi:small basic protein